VIHGHGPRRTITTPSLGDIGQDWATAQTEANMADPGIGVDGAADGGITSDRPHVESTTTRDIQ